MFKKKTLILGLVLFCLMAVFTLNVYAQDTAPGATFTNSGSGKVFQFDNPIKAKSLAALLSDILSIIIQIGIPIIVIMVIFTGFTFVTAQGNQAKITLAKNALFSVVIGSAIVIGAYAISQAIQNTVKDLQGNTSASTQPLGIPNLGQGLPAGWQ